jgi:hypothetical protein
MEPSSTADEYHPPDQSISTSELPPMIVVYNEPKSVLNKLPLIPSISRLIAMMTPLQVLGPLHDGNTKSPYVPTAVYVERADLLGKAIYIVGKQAQDNYWNILRPLVNWSRPYWPPREPGAMVVAYPDKFLVSKGAERQKHCQVLGDAADECRVLADYFRRVCDIMTWDAYRYDPTSNTIGNEVSDLKSPHFTRSEFHGDFEDRSLRLQEDERLWASRRGRLVKLTRERGKGDYRYVSLAGVIRCPSEKSTN